MYFTAFLFFLQQGEGSKSVCDIAAPVAWAEQQKRAFDLMMVMTDFRHPKAFSDLAQALRQYRQALSLPDAK